MATDKEDCLASRAQSQQYAHELCAHDWYSWRRDVLCAVEQGLSWIELNALILRMPKICDCWPLHCERCDHIVPRTHVCHRGPHRYNYAIELLHYYAAARASRFGVTMGTVLDHAAKHALGAMCGALRTGRLALFKAIYKRERSLNQWCTSHLFMLRASLVQHLLSKYTWGTWDTNAAMRALRDPRAVRAFLALALAKMQPTQPYHTYWKQEWCRTASTSTQCAVRCQLLLHAVMTVRLVSATALQTMRDVRAEYA